MEATRRPRPADPEFDPSPPAPVRLREFDPLEFQRLVVNPFLAVFGLVVLVEVGRGLGGSELPPLAILVVIPMAMLHHLIQYHCLDCGRTLWFRARRRHTCDPMLARWRERRSGRWPLPDLGTQMMLWFIVIGTLHE